MGLFRKGYVNVSSSTDAIPITFEVRKTVSESALPFGFVEVFVPNATSAVAILENDPNLYEEYKKWIETQVPANNEKRPDRRSGSGRSFAHIRAQKVGQFVVLPIAEGKLQIGNWQEIVFFDFDDKVSRREYYIIASGEAAATK